MRKIILAIAYFIPFLVNAQFQWLPLETAIGSGIGGSSANGLVVLNNRVYFEGFNSATTGAELYATNGTQIGTNVVADLAQTPGFGSSPRNLTVFNNEIYFTAGVETFGRELFKTNGTTTIKVKNNPVGIYQSDPKSLLEVNGQLYYFAKEENSIGYDLWKTDGTSNGTVKAKELDLINNDTRLISNVGNYLIYVGKPEGDTIIGNEIYSFNTITNETTLLLDIAGNGAFNSENYRNLIAFDNKIFFTNANNLYFSDGQNQAILLSSGLYSGLRNFIVFNNQLIFFASTQTSGIDIFKCVATGLDQYQISKIYNFFPNTTLPYDPINLPIDDFKIITLNNKLYFAATEEINGANKKIYETDGITTHAVVTMNFSVQPIARQVYNLTAMNNKLYFQMTGNPPSSSSPYYEAIWEADPATGFYQEITSTNSGPFENIPRFVPNYPMIVMNNELYLTATNATFNQELWKLSSNQLNNSDFDFKNKISVYPNPTTNILNIETVAENDFTIEIYDLIGKKVAQYSNQKQIDISELVIGTYLVKITDVATQKTSVTKVLKN